MAMAKPKKKRRWLRRLITWLILLTVAAGAFALFVLPTWQAEATTTYVKYTASRGTISNALSFSGSVSVVNNETLTAGAAGTVRTVYVAEGDQVESGDKLMRLSSGETIKAGFDGTVPMHFWGQEIQKRTEECVEAVEDLIFELQMMQFDGMIEDMRDCVEDIK